MVVHCDSLTMDDGWKVAPLWYEFPMKDSVLLKLVALKYSEAWTVSNGIDDAQPVLVLNVMMNLWLGLTTRIFAFVAMCVCNRSKVGKVSFTQSLVSEVVNPLQDFFLSYVIEHIMSAANRLQQQLKTEQPSVISVTDTMEDDDEDKDDDDEDNDSKDDDS